LRRGPADLALIAALCGLGIILRWSLTSGVLRDSPPFAAWHLPEGLIWMTVLLMLLIAPLRLKPLLNNRVLSGLGVLSYSIYMVHVPLIATAFIILRGTQPVLVGWSVRTGALAVALSALCLAVSWASYRLIERPFLTRKARVDR
jgi:peptidoglycan/LPS O-acetylase OafA/YrhL